MIQAEEIYTWDDYSGTRYVFMVDRIAAYCECHQIPCQTVGVNDSLRDYLTERAEIDETIIAQMTTARRDQPALICAFPTNEHVLIDGNHRAVRRMRDGFDDFQARILPLIFLKAAGFVIQTKD